ncbi:Dps family protein [Streptomyces sp. MAR4 CNX-425]|uniref:Dps family protein n=1 Tax=Streptomyces sp. MAR4 CNX-425 TaxID=3406343 RepID=UPI003B509C33
MTTTPSRAAPVRSPLPETTGRATAAALQGALVDLLDLSLVAKQAHWTVVGPRFRSIHLQLDEVVTTTRGHADTVAERSATLGQAPSGTARTVAETSALPQPEPGWMRDTAVVELMIHALGDVIGRMRERIDLTAKTDPVTQDVFVNLTAELEKQSWMFQAEHVG